MKKLIFCVAVVLLSAPGMRMRSAAKAAQVAPPPAMIDFRSLGNPTSDYISVTLHDVTTNQWYYYTVPPNSGTIVLGQIPANDDIYSATLISSGGAHNMEIYWAHGYNVTRLDATDMALGCVSCAFVRVTS